MSRFLLYSSKIDKLIFFFFFFTILISLNAEEENKFIQDNFVIGLWVAPPLDDKAKIRYKELADANFTLVIGHHKAKKEDNEKLLKICKKYDLKAIVGIDRLKQNEYPTSKACWGYLIIDEPVLSQFDELGNTVKRIRNLYPKKLSYINLFPNYAPLSTLGTVNYDKYVSKYMEIVKPDILCMDHYPTFRPNEDGREGYCSNLDSMRNFSLKHNVPFWNFFNIMPYGHHTDPTEAQVRWQIFTSLAYGAKGVLYFCYYTPKGDEFPKGGAIIAVDGSKTRHYDEAKRINSELKNMGNTLMQLTSTAVFRIPPKSNPEEILKDSPIKSISKNDIDPEMDYLIGTFKHNDGREAVLINNYHFAYTAWPTVEFRKDISKITEIDKKSGKEIPLKDDSPAIPGVQISLGAGDGRLFLIAP